MDARGFGALDKRTNITRLNFNRVDKALCIGGVVVLVLSVALRFLGVGVLIEGTL